MKKRKKEKAENERIDLIAPNIFLQPVIKKIIFYLIPLNPYANTQARVLVGLT